MIPITKPTLGNEEASAATETILSGWVTLGPKTKEFEDLFTSKVDTRYSCAVSSCTTALHLALLVVGVRPGDIVITASHSFIATANAVRSCGAEPIFVDIDPDTFNLDPDKLEECLQDNFNIEGNGIFYKYIDRLVTPESPLQYFVESSNPPTRRKGRVAAILPVHQMGIPCDIQQIVEIANKFNLPVVEDAACAIGSEISMNNGQNWEKIGKPHGDIACFSFHPRKIITTGDGGMLTTNNPEQNAMFKLLRQHGMNVQDNQKADLRQVVSEKYVVTGYNYRFTDIQSAIGIEQLKKLETIVNARRNLARQYEEIFGNSSYAVTVKANNRLPNWQSYPVRLTSKVYRTQPDIMRALFNKGISTRRGIMNIHQEPPYKNSHWTLPHSEDCRDNVILIPLYPEMGMEKVDYIAKTVLSEIKRTK